MAQGGTDRLKQVLQIQELFHGRFSLSEATRLLEIYNWDTPSTIEFIFTEDEKISLEECICPTQQADGHTTSMCSKYAIGKFELLAAIYGGFKDLDGRIEIGVDLAEEWSEVGADRRHISKSVRQFACLSCDKSWWKKVPRRKMVSKCFRCKQKYDALQRADEWGWAEFRCKCGNIFGGFCQRITSSPCRKCHSDMFPCKIIPPISRRGAPRARRHIDTHVCNAPDCIAMQTGPYPNRRRGRARDPEVNVVPNPNQTPQTCVHPRNRDGYCKKVVVAPSSHHVSSGSTIDTCLTQDDLSDLVSVIDGINSYQERTGPMRTIHEDRSDHSSGDDDGNTANP